MQELLLHFQLRLQGFRQQLFFRSTQSSGLGFRLQAFLAIGLKQDKLELRDPKPTNSKLGGRNSKPDAGTSTVHRP